MNKAALIKRIAEEAGTSNKDAEKMVESFVDVVIDELKKGNQVNISGFGTFLTRTRHARGGVNPQKPDERIRIPEVRVAKFKTGKRLKDSLKGER